MQKNTMIIGIIAILLASAVIVSAGADDVEATDGNQVVYTTDGTEGTLMFYIDGDIAQRPQINITFEDGSYLRLTGTVVEGGVSVSRESISNLDGTIEYTVYPLNGGSGDNYAQGTFNAGVVTFDGDGATGAMESVRAGGAFTLPENGFEIPTGKEFGGWIVNGVGEPVAAGTTIEITGDMTITAVWNDSGEPTQTTVSFVADGNGSFEITPEGSVTVDVGTSIIANGDTLTIGDYTITAKSGENYEFSHWEYSGTSVTENMTIRAVFTETVGPGPDPEPEVLDSITVSGEFDDVYQVGDVLDLDGMVVTAHYTNGGEDKDLSEGDYTVTPANGSRLDSVIDHVTVSYTENGVTKTVDVKITVTKLPTYLVSKDCVNGTVSGPAEIVKGGSGNYIVTPDYGYRISAVSYTVGEGQSVTVNVEDVMRCSFEIQNVTGAVTITATFVSDATGTVTVTAGDHGSIGAGGATSAQVTVYGHWSTTVTIDPDNGYRVSGISHDGAENSVTYEDGVLTIAAGSTVSKIDIAFEQIPVSDDDEEYVPPVITVIPGDDDDSTTYIVAIAAAAVLTTEKKGLNASTN